MKRSIAGLACGIAILGGALGAPPMASASPETARMAFANLLQGPLDVVTAPVVAGRTAYHNASEVGLEPVGPVAYTILGHLGLTALQAAWGTARTLSGALMLLPAMVLFPFENVDLPKEADVFGQGNALLAAENPLAEEPAWVRWNPVTTPATVDAAIGIEVPHSRYLDTQGVGATYGDETPE